MLTICRKTAWIAVISLFVLGACKKDHGDPVTPATDDGGRGIAVSSKDSMYFIFKDEYLWNDVIPDSATFKPNSYSSLDDMFAALISYKKDAGGNYLDRYGFLDDGSVAGEIGEGVAGDFGLEIDYNSDTDLRAIYVYQNSPAYQQGVRRTWQITAVNGNTNLTYDGRNGPNVTMIRNAVYNSNSVTLTFKKPDGSPATLTLNTAQYNINPVLYSSVINLGGKKIGYLVFNQFINIEKAQASIDAAFNSFGTGVTDLIVDFRYNGGGSVETAEYLANLIAPASVGSNGTTLMYKETFNTNLSNHQYSKYLQLKIPGSNDTWGSAFDYWVSKPNFYFKKQGSLNISNVVFIGTGSTASASELVINVLKPYMNVKLVGDTTYGKPVGFVGIHVAGVDMYAVSIWSKNAQGQGDYFNGMYPTDAPVPANEEYEDYSKDWGSTNEVYLRRALKQLGLTDAELGRKAPATESLRKLLLNNPMPDKRFKGMIETRIKLR